MAPPTPTLLQSTFASSYKSTDAAKRASDEDHDLDRRIISLLRPMSVLSSSGTTHAAKWRLDQLSKLRRLVTDNVEAILEALRSDLGKDPIQATYTEIDTVVGEIDHISCNLKRWMKPRPVPTPGIMAVAFSHVRKMPLCTGADCDGADGDGLGRPACLVIGSFNYPFSLCMLPAIGSLAGGNPTVIKPSEKCPETSRLLARLVSTYFDDGDDHVGAGALGGAKSEAKAKAKAKAALKVVEGGVDVTSALLRQPWGLVFFTGSERVGRIVAQAAAKTLTPTILELGGKTPCYVARDCPDDFRSMSDRIVWAKTLNCGQTCVAPDYVLCDESHVSRLCDELVRSTERMFGKDPTSSELSRIVDADAAWRLVKMIREVEDAAESSSSSSPSASTLTSTIAKDNDNDPTVGTKILCGGTALSEPDRRYVPPTIVLNPPRNSRILSEEIFGPILPIVPVRNEKDAINFIRSMPGTPLNICIFASTGTYERVVKACPAAGSHRNDCIIANGSTFLPFGGLGSSGYGRYHGKYSFDAFTHEHMSLYKPCHWLFEFGGLRYHPYNGSKLFVRISNILPTIPVLHTRTLLLGIATTMAVAFTPALRSITAVMLRKVADFLVLVSKRLERNGA